MNKLAFANALALCLGISLALNPSTTYKTANTFEGRRVGRTGSLQCDLCKYMVDLIEKKVLNDENEQQILGSMNKVTFTFLQRHPIVYTI